MRNPFESFKFSEKENGVSLPIALSFGKGRGEALNCRKLKTLGYFVLLPALLLCCNIAQAQVAGLDEILSGTLNNYPSLKQREAQYATSLAHQHTVTGNILPSLLLQEQLNVGTNNSIEGSYFPFGVIPSLSGGNIAKTNGNLNEGNLAIAALQWEFCNFGYYKAQAEQAKSVAEKQAAEVEAEKYKVTVSVVLRYIDWLKKYRLVQIKNDDVQRAGVILNAIRANVLSGLKPGVDSSTARAAYSGARIAWLQALDEFNNDRIALAVYSGLNLNKKIPDTGITSSALLTRLGLMGFPDKITAEHPLLKPFQLDYKAEIAATNIDRKRYLPRLDLNGAYWYRNSGLSPTGTFADGGFPGAGIMMPYSAYNYLVGVSATYDLFDLRHRRDLLAEGKSRETAKYYALQTESQNLDAFLQQTKSSYETTVQELTEIPVQTHSAREAYEQQLALYTNGLNTLIDVTNAEYALLQAETNLVVTQTDLLKLLFMRAALSEQSEPFFQNLKKQ